MKNGHYAIGEISKLCCVPISKLRYYDEIGVIKPCFVDEETGYRYYDNETLLLISILKYYRNCGFKLKEIQELLKRMDLNHLEPMFDRRIAELEQQIIDLQIQRDSIAAWRDLIHEEKSVMAQEECAISHRWYAPTAMYVSTPYAWEGMPYETLIANVEMCNHISNSSDCTIGALSLYFPTGNRRCFTNAKIYIRPHPRATSTTTRETVGGFAALACYHKGSFETGEETYKKIYQHAAAHNITLRGDSFERSVIDWWSTKKEEEFLLEIILPTTETVPGQFEQHSF